jgi:hypothetical protein
MEITKESLNVEDDNRADHRLAEELESLYRRVAQLDQPDASPENGTDALGDDNHFMAPGRLDAPQQNPLNREKLMERLMAIQNAYERILTCWPYTVGCPPQPSSKKVSTERLAEPGGFSGKIKTCIKDEFPL